MSDQQSQKLQMLQRVKLLREQEATRDLGSAIKVRDQIDQKGKLLEGYLEEYESGQQGVTDTSGATDLLNYRQFLGNMQGAASALEVQQKNEDKKVSSLREEWVGCRADKKAVEKLLKERLAHETRIAEKRADQEFTDRGREDPFQSE